MQGIQIDSAELDRLVERLEQSPEIMREAKRQAFEAAAPKLLALVQGALGPSRKVRTWQEKFVGSKGGYAAVRPKAKTWTEKNGAEKRYAVGYVTNAVNSGHYNRGSGFGQDKRLRTYRTMNSLKRVAGKHFYEAANEQAGPVAQEAAEQIVAALIEHLEE